MNVWYNDNEPYAAQWLRNLVGAGHLPRGDVDGRSILDVGAADVGGYAQCHFFAGLGGWPYALRLARWPFGRPVWTASCPCQSLSSAGSRREHVDRRHLWPALYRLVAECRPPVLFGEQVASKAGREWLAAVRADLEHLGYAVGAADLPAAGVGAPHIRQRLWFVADARGARFPLPEPGELPAALGDEERRAVAEHGGWSAESGMGGGSHGLSAGMVGCGAAKDAMPAAWANGSWEDGIPRVAAGVAGRVGQLRAYGNAVVPQLAAEFIEAYLELGRHGQA